jgi:NADPH-dependent curcumin reductase CurA
MDAQTEDTDGKRIPTINRQILLASRPSGEPSPDNFQLAETEIPKPGSGQMLLRTVYLSLDPYMRGRMDPGPSYAPRVEIGQVMVGRSVCEVVESKIPNYRPGDIVLAGGDGKNMFYPTAWRSEK